MTLTIRTTPRTDKNTAPSIRAAILHALNWLAEQDQTYREAQKLARMDTHRLDDMGILPTGQNSDFYHKYGNRPSDRARIAITNGW